jgi:hypothetical protein
MHQLAVTASLATFAFAQSPTPSNPLELGAVAWTRDFDAGMRRVRETGAPAFVLFQEIPGCSTCTGFGKDVLSHPLLAPAIEQCFVPIAQRNNAGGTEGEVRERLLEPAWNNPVVRFLDADGKDLLPRRDGVWDAHGIAARMIDALGAAKRPVPGYLRVALAESDPATATAVFAMHCFWAGEAALGALDGVVRTRAAFAGGEEVVEVTFLPAVLPRGKLTELAQAQSCRAVSGEAKQAPASDQQHALGGTPYARLALTPMQRTKLHAALTLGTDAKQWLTPAQVAALARKDERR